METLYSCGCERRRAITNELDGPQGYSLLCMDIPPYEEVYWMGTRPEVEFYVLTSKAVAEEWAKDHVHCNCSEYM